MLFHFHKFLVAFFKNTIILFLFLQFHCHSNIGYLLLNHFYFDKEIKYCFVKALTANANWTESKWWYYALLAKSHALICSGSPVLPHLEKENFFYFCWFFLWFILHHSQHLDYQLQTLIINPPIMYMFKIIEGTACICSLLSHTFFFTWKSLFYMEQRELLFMLKLYAIPL
jgi:hypothetical protein